MNYIFDEETLRDYQQLLVEDEKCPSTIQKYLRDLERFRRYAGEGQAVTKELVIRYKQELLRRYALSTANGNLASLNGFFRRMGWNDCTVKPYRSQHAAFRSQDRDLEKEEYLRLLAAAEARGDERLCLLMQTICSTGIRISELPYITVEALRDRRARVSLKGKTRIVILPGTLCRELLGYARRREIRTGSVFVTRNGRPLDRSNVFRAMKGLCEAADVDPCKVFPHNFRHLFACTYYQQERDIARLADILGHSSIDTTRIYLAKSSGEQEGKIERLGLLI